MLGRLSTKWLAPVLAILLTLGLVFGANSLRTHSSAAPGISAAATDTTPAHITLATPEWNLTFSDLSSITSKIKPADTTSGASKQFGDPQPPTVVLKRSLDPTGNQTLYAWHQAARQNLPAARVDVTLTVDETGGTITYTLVNAWLSKLDVSGLTAGSKQPAMETVTIICDNIVVH